MKVVLENLTKIFPSRDKKAGKEAYMHYTLLNLAPLYGERTPLASELEDYLVIDEVPDVFHTGHVHINTYRKFKGIHLITSFKLVL